MENFVIGNNGNSASLFQENNEWLEDEGTTKKSNNVSLNFEKGPGNRLLHDGWMNNTDNNTIDFCNDTGTRSNSQRWNGTEPENSSVLDPAPILVNINNSTATAPQESLYRGSAALKKEDTYDDDDDDDDDEYDYSNGNTADTTDDLFGPRNLMLHASTPLDEINLKIGMNFQLIQQIHQLQQSLKVLQLQHHHHHHHHHQQQQQQEQEQQVQQNNNNNAVLPPPSIPSFSFLANNSTNAAAAIPASSEIEGSGGPPKFDSWKQRFQELQEFHARYGHTVVPHNYTPNLSLAQWVKRQRNQRKAKLRGETHTMTNERERALNGIHFVWDAHAAIWEERWNDLLRFKERHGHCNVPSTFPENPKLAVWVKCQRRHRRLWQQNNARSSMTKERFLRLSSIGFNWNPRNL